MIRIFNHYISKMLFVIGVVEAIFFASSIYLAVIIRFYNEGDYLVDYLDGVLPKALIFSFVMIVSMTGMGLYWRQSREPKFLGILFKVCASVLLSLLVMSLLFYIFPGLLIGRGLFSIAITISLLGVIFIRFIYFTYADQDAMKRNVLIVGAGDMANQIVTSMRRKSDRKDFNICGYLHLKGQKDSVPSNKIIKDYDSIIDVVKQYHIHEIIIAIDDRRMNFPAAEVLDCKLNGIEVFDIAEFFERQTGKLKLDTLHPSNMIFSDGFGQSMLKNLTKRIFDISVSLVILFFSTPIMFLTALLIFIEAGFSGPIFYRQERVGKNGQLFGVIKFRSMRNDAEKDGGAQWAKKNDDRVTSVGRFIRKARIDELPQLFNVLKGEMSFVGPRPERPQFVDKLGEELPYYKLRHKIKPGITGWAQICYPYGASFKDSYEKLQYDLYYLKNCSFVLDLVILFQTIHAVLWGRGAR